MKLNLSVKPLCLVLSLVLQMFVLRKVLRTGAMHKNGSTALGKESKAGENATALGDKAAAAGYKSVAAGYDSNASGLSASALAVRLRRRHCGRLPSVSGRMQKEPMILPSAAHRRLPAGSRWRSV